MGFPHLFKHPIPPLNAGKTLPPYKHYQTRYPLRYSLRWLKLPLTIEEQCTFSDVFLKNLSSSASFALPFIQKAHSALPTLHSPHCGGSGKQPCHIRQQHHRRFPALYEKRHQIYRIRQYHGSQEKGFLLFIFYGL